MRIRIGTRSSPLAMYQANLVKRLLEKNGANCTIIGIDSKGDLNLKQPLYEIGITGIFTKTLDTALINQQIDIAVHSLKDVPTLLPNNIEITACIERGNPNDTLIYKSDIAPTSMQTIATGSLRRKAFWLNQYPNHCFEDLRGNIQTRLNKLQHNQHWEGAIFAQAGIERGNLAEMIKKNHFKTTILDWMLPAPSQGIIAVASLTNDSKIKSIINQINHTPTQFCADLERSFLRTLEGGCSMPVGIRTQITQNNTVLVKAAVLSLDGQEKHEINQETSYSNAKTNGQLLAKQILNDPNGSSIVRKLKSQQP